MFCRCLLSPLSLSAASLPTVVASDVAKVYVPESSDFGQNPSF